MNLMTKILVLMPSALMAASGHAQFVKGNEAIFTKSDGSRQVATPPLPSATLGPPCKAENPACTSRGWLMVETAAGLQECTEYYARPGTCRASTFGSEKRPRLWIVKLKGEWFQCQQPDIASKCISLKALPTSIVQ